MDATFASRKVAFFLLIALRLCSPTSSQGTDNAPIPGLVAVPPGILPFRSIGGVPLTSPTPGATPTSPTQAGCAVPTVGRDDFSASQVAILVSDLQQAISPDCYGVLSTTLALCLPDLSLLSGCCTAACGRALRMGVSPQCLTEFWSFICNNSTFFLPHIGAVTERCLWTPDMGPSMTCPPNQTLIQHMPLLSLQPAPGDQVGGNSSTMELSNTASGRYAMTIGRDCTKEVPKLWPDFNGSLIFNSLFVFASDIPGDCLRLVMSYVPSCYDDMTYETGCCSLRCRAALEKRGPFGCAGTLLKPLCTRIPTLAKYLFGVSARCANVSLSCESFNGGPLPGPNASLQLQVLPLIASESGECPIDPIPWPNYNALTVATQTLQLVSEASTQCSKVVAATGAACMSQLSVQQGCCSYNCALALRDVPDDCHTEFRVLLCKQPQIGKYSLSLADRCLGVGHQC